MRAVVLDGHGPPEVLRVADIPPPTMGPDDLLVDVHDLQDLRAPVGGDDDGPHQTVGPGSGAVAAGGTNTRSR